MVKVNLRNSRSELIAIVPVAEQDPGRPIVHEGVEYRYSGGHSVGQQQLRRSYYSSSE